MVTTNLSHYNTQSHIPPQFLFLFSSRIGLDKPTVRAKGINHPKYSVKPEYACLTHESASPAATFLDGGIPTARATV